MDSSYTDASSCCGVTKMWCPPNGVTPKRGLASSHLLLNPSHLRSGRLLPEPLCPPTIEDGKGDRGCHSASQPSPRTAATVRGALFGGEEGARVAQKIRRARPVPRTQSVGLITVSRAPVSPLAPRGFRRPTSAPRIFASLASGVSSEAGEYCQCSAFTASDACPNPWDPTATCPR
jgi:hypothetical protein